MAQLELFPNRELPAGFVYRPDFLSTEQEAAALREIQQLEFGKVEMHGVVARRRTAHFGLSYSYETRQVKTGTPMPEFLLALREMLPALSPIEPEEFVEALVSEYPAGAGIGWHRDAPAFGVIAGVSFLSECRMRLRPQPESSTFEGTAPNPPPTRTKSLVQVLEPRSAYILQGDVRWRWQHHIPPTEHLRYSITYRTLRSGFKS
jgi:alkylated DNA repair dioxygenase AlkB